MTHRRTLADELDPFDPLDEVEVDESDEFGIAPVSVMDGLEAAWYSVHAEQNPLCDFGFGDSDGLCIKARFGCHIEGCGLADRN